MVATRNRGHRELIREDENGFLVAVNDDAAMTNRILKLLDSEEECRRIGETACAFAKQYGFTNVKRQLEEIYFG